MGSAPSSPKHQRSNMSTPGLRAGLNANVEEVDTGCQAVEETILPEANIDNPASNSSIINLYKQQSQPKQYLGSVMSRSMEGPRSLPVHSPASRPHSNSSTLDRK